MTRYVLDDGDYRYDEARPALAALSVVITRFNMALPNFREVGGFQDDDAFAGWLEARLPIFENICLRSLRAQSRRPDAWLLGFDAAHPERVEAVLKMIKPYPWIRPVWQKVVDGKHESARVSFIREINQLLTPEHRYVLSTRVDNDDALGRGYCEGRDQFAAGVVESRPELDDFWIAFPLGAQLSRSRLRLYPQNNNAFLSRCESVTRYGGVRGGSALHWNHGHVFEKGLAFKAMSRAPIWMQYVHGSNVLNKENGTLAVLAEVDVELRRFGLVPEELRAAGMIAGA